MCAHYVHFLPPGAPGACTLCATRHQLDPRLLDPRLLDPRLLDPRLLDPRLLDPRLPGACCWFCTFPSGNDMRRVLVAAYASRTHPAPCCLGVEHVSATPISAGPFAGWRPRPQAPGPRPQAPGPRPQAPGPRPQAPGPRPQAPGPRPGALGCPAAGFGLCSGRGFVLGAGASCWGPGGCFVAWAGMVGYTRPTRHAPNFPR
jgi:hypothetical protein